MEERLQKLMARANLGSRRENEKTILAGRVRVNGRVAKLGEKADPNKDKIEVNGRLLKLRKQKMVYIALNKPKGVISSLDDEMGRGRRTVRDLLNIPGHLYPVGRLDKQSTGLMLMTNDGDLAHKLTHPRYGHEKTYSVTIEGKIGPEQLGQWRKGVRLDGKRTAPAKVRIVNQEVSFTQLEIVMREGKKRQIRRVATMLGFPVQHLIRKKIGPLELGALKPGEWRYLTPKEINGLKKAAASPPLLQRKRKQKPKTKQKRKRGKSIGR